MNSFFHWVALVGLASFGLTLTLDAAPVNPAEATQGVFTTTASGTVMGYRFAGVSRYLGIPYATAQRFELAQPVPSWTGIRPALNYGEVAPQGKGEKSPFNLAEAAAELVENEAKALNLNIWTTNEHPKALKPVIVWIHGGAFESGSSFEQTFYEGANLAKAGDVVFVSVNHRLNVLGYLDLSAYGSEYDHTGNLGQLDLVAALQWVHNNIAQFGGDPANVTIDGQSGGGTKVTVLMGMPAAQGLFQKAVDQSGAQVFVRAQADARAQSARLLDVLHLTAAQVGQLKTLDYKTLLAAARQAQVVFGPVVDGLDYPESSLALSKNIPLLAGNVMGEFGSNFGPLVLPAPSADAWAANNIASLSDTQVKTRLQARYGNLAEPIAAAFQTTYPGHPLADALYVNNRAHGFSVQGIIDQAVSQGLQVYAYLQAYDYPMFGGVVPVHTGSCIPFFFRNLDKVNLFIAGDEGTAQKVSDQMSGALIQFLKTGNPSQPGLAWPAYTADQASIMVFDRQTAVRPHFDDQLNKLLDQVPAPKF